MLNIRIGKISKLLSPSYGSCLRCGTTWNFVENHCTDYGDSSGCFPLCEKCWSEITIEERILYYKQLWNQWNIYKKRDIEEWNCIEKAVLEGK